MRGNRVPHPAKREQMRKYIAADKKIHSAHHTHVHMLEAAELKEKSSITNLWLQLTYTILEVIKPNHINIKLSVLDTHSKLI